MVVAYTTAWILSQRILINLHGTQLSYSGDWVVSLTISQIRRRGKGTGRRTERGQ